MSSNSVQEGRNTKKATRAPSMQARPHPGSDIVNEIQLTEPEDPTDEIIMPKEEDQSFSN